MTLFALLNVLQRRLLEKEREGERADFYRKGTKTENIKLLIYKDIEKDSANTAFGRFALKLNYLNKQ